MPENADLLDMTRGECLRLLSKSVIGRVVYSAAAMPAAQPVGFVLDGEEIVFRVDDGTALAHATRHAIVGFEADDIDPTTSAGWWVLGVGETYEITDPERLADLITDHAAPWLRNDTPHTIAVPLQLLIGRRLQPAGPAGSPG